MLSRLYEWNEKTLIRKRQVTTLVDCRTPTEGALHRHTMMTSVTLQAENVKTKQSHPTPFKKTCHATDATANKQAVTAYRTRNTSKCSHRRCQLSAIGPGAQQENDKNDAQAPESERNKLTEHCAKHNIKTNSRHANPSRCRIVNIELPPPPLISNITSSSGIHAVSFTGRSATLAELGR